MSDAEMKDREFSEILLKQWVLTATSLAPELCSTSPLNKEI